MLIFLQIFFSLGTWESDGKRGKMDGKREKIFFSLEAWESDGQRVKMRFVIVCCECGLWMCVVIVCCETSGGDQNEARDTGKRWNRNYSYMQGIHNDTKCGINSQNLNEIGINSQNRLQGT